MINAQFQATTEKLTASSPDLANIVNKNLIQLDKITDNRKDFIAKKIIVEQPKTQLNDLWAEEDDDDDNDISESRTVNSNDSVHIQKVR